MARKRTKKPKQPKYEIIPDTRDSGPHKLLVDLVKKFHTHLCDAKFAIAWWLDLKPDADGHTKLGKCIKASDLDRKLHDFDFVILLNKAWWTRDDTTDPMRRALMDHEVTHAQVVIDKKTGEPKTDDTGRTMYRIRKHDVEEFFEVIQRNKFWKKDLQFIADEAIKLEKSKTPLFDKPDDDSTNGTIKMNAAARKVKRRE